MIIKFGVRRCGTLKDLSQTYIGNNSQQSLLYSYTGLFTKQYLKPLKVLHDKMKLMIKPKILYLYTQKFYVLQPYNINNISVKFYWNNLEFMEKKYTFLGIYNYLLLLGSQEYPNSPLASTILFLNNSHQFFNRCPFVRCLQYLWANLSFIGQVGMENLRSKTNGRPFEREIVKFEFKLESSTFVLYFLGGYFVVSSFFSLTSLA